MHCCVRGGALSLMSIPRAKPPSSSSPTIPTTPSQSAIRSRSCTTQRSSNTPRPVPSGRIPLLPKWPPSLAASMRFKTPKERVVPRIGFAPTKSPWEASPRSASPKEKSQPSNFSAPSNKSSSNRMTNRRRSKSKSRPANHITWENALEYDETRS